jgi:hypothetical protein
MLEHVGEKTRHHSIRNAAASCQPRSAMRKPFAAAANCKPWQPLPILVYVLTLVRLVVPDETPCRGALSSVSSHVPRDSVTARP